MKKALVGLIVFVGVFIGFTLSLSAQFNILHNFGGEPNGRNPYGDLVTDGTYCFGMTNLGGVFGQGTVFRFQLDGSGYKLLHSFAGGANDGKNPYGSLIVSGGVLYGMTYSGGASDVGTIFKINPDGSGFSLLHPFDGNGKYPVYGSLIISGGVIYGMTYKGGASDVGTIFKINPDGSGFALLHSFDGPGLDGAWPYGSLAVSGGVLYGMTLYGGASNNGTIFKINPDGNGFALLHSFVGGTGDGRNPLGSLIVSGGVLYGMAQAGGASNNGAIFKINPDGSGFALLHSFAGGGGGVVRPYGSLIVSGGVLYGMTLYGGASNNGTIFKMNPDGSGFALLHSFPGGGGDGQNPYGSLVESNGVLYGMTETGGASGHGTIFKINPDGSGYTVLPFFSSGPADGINPYGSLNISGEVLFGMTSATNGGGDGRGLFGGTIFKINPDSKEYTLVHQFFGEVYPYGSLIDFGGVLYGMTNQGYITDFGFIFKINPDGSNFQGLQNFGYSPAGNSPQGSLIESGGVLYGMTSSGGTSNRGTIFKINPNGSGFALLHSFAPDSGDGKIPYGSLIVFGGALYGMTSSGGASSYGTIFKMNPDGSGYTVLHSFNGDGNDPYGSLIVSGGVLYGTTYIGGASNLGTVFKINPDGSGFALLHSFAGGVGDGKKPCGDLFDSGGVLYGMTTSGGPSDGGTIFKINPDGSGFALLHSFAGGVLDGKEPHGSLIGFGGALYGMTLRGGFSNIGVIFSLSIGPSGPTVTTAAVTSVTETNAMTGGNVTSDGGASVIDRGVCVSTSANPTLSNAHTHDGTGTGAFTSSLTNATPGTTYHVRAYATNSMGTAYGSDLTFTTLSLGAVPTVTTTAISSLTTTSFLTGGNVTSDGSAAVTDRGVCVSTAANPTIVNAHTHDGTGTGVFVSSLTGCTPGETYHVRAYATSTVGTAYGADIWFQTLGGSKNDFNQDGQSDILWRNMTTGENAVWFMGYAATGVDNLQTTGLQKMFPGLVRETGDLFKGKPDIVYLDPREGTENANPTTPPAIFMEPMGSRRLDMEPSASVNPSQGGITILGLTRTSVISLPSLTDFNWVLAGTGDFNGDGWPDLVLRNMVTGENGIWYIVNGTKIGADYMPSVTDLNWKIVGTGDFNGDKKPDLVWRNSATGENFIWFMNGAARIGGDTPPSVTDQNWTIVGTGDFNGDGKPDFLWHNVVTGENYIWFMDGATRIGGDTPPMVSDVNWQIGGVDDFNGDGRPDILWRNYLTGENGVWYMNGALRIGTEYVPTIADVAWKIMNR